MSRTRPPTLDETIKELGDLSALIKQFTVERKLSLRETARMLQIIMETLDLLENAYERSKGYDQ